MTAGRLNFEAADKTLSRDERIDRLLATEDIRSVIARAIRAGDRIDAELMTSCFRADAPVDYSPLFKGRIEDLVAVFDTAPSMSAASQYMIGTQLIDVDGDRAKAETYAWAYRKFHECDDQGGAFYRLSGFRYLDTLDRQDDVWKIAARAYIHEWSIVQSMTIERPSIGLYDRDPSQWAGEPVLPQRDRTDLSYTF